GGSIRGTCVCDGNLVLTAMRFREAEVRGACAVLSDFASAFDAGVSLGQQLSDASLRLVFVLSNGLVINGSEVVRGLAAGLPKDVPISGGLAADGAAFKDTLLLSKGKLVRSGLCAVGLYGESLRVGCGFAGGWSAFGPERVITRSSGNLLYELDGCSALKLYRDYLGPYAEGLPAAALRFPLSVRAEVADSPQVVRTILGIDDEAMRFAGDVPEGHLARFMFSSTARLVDGAAVAAQRALEQHGGTPQLAILVSCVGRRLLMAQEAEDELDAVVEPLRDCKLSGFYANGEICHTMPGEALHNQTMTVTLLSEN
ncbi:MAG: FIST C-terminal domain-containing protein, partial [Myxococcales bacterium]|nr:FIST C-terminal domain-containing protein [Myxococcales bacterium]